ncbi:MAG: hypothetical protein ACYTEL_11215 [Planctomycetota bacterium]|jgi:hypothetical protein
MKIRDTFYLWLLPGIWAPCSIFHFFHPGDEYAMWAYSAIAGSWIVYIGPFDEIDNLLVPISVAAAGALVMAVVGFVMDRMRVNRTLWTVLFAVAAVAVFIKLMPAFGSIERVLARNGFMMPYVFSAILLAVYISVIASLLISLFAYIVKRIRRIPHAPEP